MKLTTLDKKLRKAWKAMERRAASAGETQLPVRNHHSTTKEKVRRAAKRAERQLARAVIMDDLSPSRSRIEQYHTYIEEAEQARWAGDLPSATAWEDMAKALEVHMDVLNSIRMPSSSAINKRTAIQYTSIEGVPNRYHRKAK